MATAAKRPATGRTTPRKSPPAPPTPPPDDGVFDLDAYRPEGEARSDFQFRFGGETFILPGQPDVFALMDIDNGRLELGLRKLLSQRGEDQWARMQASEAVMDPERLGGLLARWEQHMGVTLGELRASRGSSRATAGRSKRTSSATTTFR